MRIVINKVNGLIEEWYTEEGDFNLADKRGMGGITYTLKGQDSKTDQRFCPYRDQVAAYDQVYQDGNVTHCNNVAMKIHTTYTVYPGKLVIEAETGDNRITQFGIDLNLNFLSKKNGTYWGQLLPSSPYTSFDGEKMYCIMPSIGKGFVIVLAKTPCRAWKICYSSYCSGHFIQDFQLLASLDELYESESHSHLTAELYFADTIEECFARIQEVYDCPMAVPMVTGSFGDHLPVRILGETDFVKVLCGGQERILPVENEQVSVESLGYGRHRVIPYRRGKAGLDTEIWFEENMDALYEKSCDAITKPYHNDENLCEGMTWCWAMASYMHFYGSKKYLEAVQRELETVMGERKPFVPRATIVPYALDGFPAYHLYRSKRIQEQFFGISILTDMYQCTGEGKYLNFAVHAAETMVRTYQRENGALIPESDYTTVCAPMIPLVDLAVLLKEIDAPKSLFFSESAEKIVHYLMNRRLHFPTEGLISEEKEEEMEEGSISCTALSVLYYCRYIEEKQEYIDFARQVLKLHDWFRSYTPDVKLYQSTMRWWETIWEGDATGPAICAGHAWSIWRGEADFHMAVLTKDPEYFLKSWNGYMTNFSKITSNGNSYACYQPDYFTGGGDEQLRRSLLTLSEDDIPKRYEIVHDYPRHYDNSLSRYVWVRACRTWLRTAVVILYKEQIVTLNCSYQNGKAQASSSVKNVYLFDLRETAKCQCKILRVEN